MTAIDDAYAAVDLEWSSAREIWQRVGVYSRYSIGHALTELAAAGAIEKHIVEPQPNLIKALYRRTA